MDIRLASGQPDEKYSSYPLSSLWKLSTLGNNNEKLFPEFLSRILHIPLGDFVGYRDGTLIPKDQLQIRSFLPSPLCVLTHTCTSTIPFLTYLSIVKDTLLFPNDKFQVISFTGNKTTTLSDGSRVYIIDQQALDRQLQGVFEMRSLRRETSGIHIVNATGIKGYATNKSQEITSIGGHVLSVTGDTELTKHCLLYGSKESLRTKTSRILQSFYSCTPIIVSRTTGVQDLQNDIRIVFGKGE